MSKKIKYGKKDVLTADDLDMKKAKIRITTMIDFPVYEALKEEAEKTGGKYQTLINKILTDYINNSSESQDLKDLILKLAKRVDKIEKKRSA